MIVAAVVLCACIALAYLVRTFDTGFATNEPTFVLLHTLCGASCVYTGYSLWAKGWGFLEITMPTIALLYLLRSKKTYDAVRTAPGALDSGYNVHAALSGRRSTDRKRDL